MKLLRYMLAAVTLLICLAGCTHAPTSGGSSDSGNIKFAGIIKYDSGITVAGAEVTLCPADYAGGLDEENSEGSHKVIRHTVTDENGYFEFAAIEKGYYLIEANDRVSHAVVFKANTEEDSSYDEYHAILKPYSVFKGRTKAKESPDVKRHLYIYGLDRKATVGDDGSFAIHNMPEGNFRGFISSGDTAEETVPIDNIELPAGDTVTISPVGWMHSMRIVINTTSTGANVTNDVTDFPLLVRLNGENFDFTESQNIPGNVHFTDMNNNTLRFTVEQWDSNGERAAIWVLVTTVYGDNNSQYITMVWDDTSSNQTVSDDNVYDTAHGFQGVWHLSDNDYNSAADATVNGFNGVAEGMNEGSIVEGIIGNAREFNGINSSIGISGSSDGKLDFPEDGYYTLSAWVSADHPEMGTQAVVAKGDEQYFLCSVEGHEGGPFWRLTEFKEGKGWEYSSTGAEAEEWVYLSGVKKGTSQYLYLDGELVDSSITLVSSTKARNTGLDVSIGKFVEGHGEPGDGFFNGMIDEVRISDVARGADWIRLCYMNQRTDDRLTAVQKEY